MTADSSWHELHFDSGGRTDFRDSTANYGSINWFHVIIIIIISVGVLLVTLTTFIILHWTVLCGGSRVNENDNKYDYKWPITIHGAQLSTQRELV